MATTDPSAAVHTRSPGPPRGGQHPRRWRVEVCAPSLDASKVRPPSSLSARLARRVFLSRRRPNSGLPRGAITLDRATRDPERTESPLVARDDHSVRCFVRQGARPPHPRSRRPARALLSVGFPPRPPTEPIPPAHAGHRKQGIPTWTSSRRITPSATPSTRWTSPATAAACSCATSTSSRSCSTTTADADDAPRRTERGTAIAGRRWSRSLTSTRERARRSCNVTLDS